MASNPKPAPVTSFRAKVSSKGQITVPVEIRRTLGLKTGDHLRFEQKDGGIHLIREVDENPFEKWRGIGIPGVAAHAVANGYTLLTVDAGTYKTSFPGIRVEST
jgi:AbrB family looped-hinge helix DNA binding protein